MSSIHLEFAENERVTAEAFMRLAAATDEFEGYAHPHALRIARLADGMAKVFRLARADRSALRFAALLHDVGEAAMKRDYISRPGPLGEEERLDLARHPVIGEQEAARVGASRGVQLLVRWHQEWWNGAGYPDALRHQQIPLAARILRVADAYAALTDARPFRPAGTLEEARKHLTQWAGIEFDPHVVRVFLSLEGLAELRSHARTEQTRTTGDTPPSHEIHAPRETTPPPMPREIPATHDPQPARETPAMRESAPPRDARATHEISATRVSGSSDDTRADTERGDAGGARDAGDATAQTAFGQAPSNL